jgi:transcriptional regulator with XRE-family HTH domain
MSFEDEEEETFPLKADEVSFGDWLNDQMEKKDVSIGQLADLSGITYTGIWNIVEGNTRSPRDETRERLAKALKVKIPKAVEQAAEAESNEIPGYEWTSFTPSDPETIPNQAGVYVLYDITDRPVYVGKSNQSVRGRIKDHATRFWFKPPLVVTGGFIPVPDKKMCGTIESILIKFLGKHALINEKGKRRDVED